jgi:hypothetical protein
MGEAIGQLLPFAVGVALAGAVLLAIAGPSNASQVAGTGLLLVTINARAVLCLIVGVKLVGDAITGFSG